MRLMWGKGVFTAITSALLAISIISAQQSVLTDEGKRKCKVRTNPQYSEIARRMGLTGKVRIEVVIAPDGHVKSSRAIGGHPLLVQSCLDAVKEWKFETAPEETTQVIEFDFKQS